MKFSSTVDSLSKENEFLRLIVKLLILAVIALTLQALSLFNREPLVVERSSRGLEIVRATPLVRNDKDVELAVQQMLRARFNTNAIAPEMFLSARQLELRTAEQRELKSRGITQDSVFRKLTVTKQNAVIEFDRVLAVGDVRSALKTLIIVGFEEVEPTELNPYGLRLSDANPTVEVKKPGAK